MAPLKQFAIPANQKDLTGNEQTNLEQQWSNNINRWTGTAIVGDPWLSVHDKDRNYYYNPLVTDVGNNPTSAPIRWTAFPNRILTNYPNATFVDQMSYAEGVHQDGTFGPPPPIDGTPYRPSGPRGWQDEYCEWITVRDANGNVTSVDFTCENPEYWFSLWREDPNRVLELYRELVSPDVQLADLYLVDNGAPVIDRSTGLPAYSAINKWNNQPSANVTGAVHLISPPNTLNAEIYLAAAATLLREQNGQPVTNPGALIQCSQYGTAGRNSDPTIGSEVNKLIAGGGLVVSLQDPVGLYLQTPDFRGYTLPSSDPNLPADAQVSECWQIIRGHARGVNDAIDFILHARFAIPQRWIDAGVTSTVSDMQINGNPILYGAQITTTFQVALRGLALPTTLPKEPLQPCRANNPAAIAAPQQVQDLNLFNAGTTSSAVTLIEQGSSVPDIVVFAVNTNSHTKINFTGGAGITVTVTDFQNVPNLGQLFTVTITAAPNATLGDRALQLTNHGAHPTPAAPGQLSVVPPGTLGIHAAPHAAAAAVKAVASDGNVLPIAAAAVSSPSAPERKAAAIEKLVARRQNAFRSL